MTKMVNAKFFGERTNHKFKISFSGCPIDCARTNEMDLGFQGAIFPEWNEDPCTGCTICASACLEDAINPDPQTGKPIFNADKCLYCSDCIRACPTNSWVEGKKGHVARVGGKHGRHPLNGPVVAKFISDEEVSLVIEKTIEWYRKNGEGKGRTRIGTILREEGKMEDYLAHLRKALGDKVETKARKPEEIRLL
jgi:dissimilatory sulfite reductase (desulfoviridin) alpha/beta subunit